MAIYPDLDTIKNIAPVGKQLEFRTLKSEFDDNAPQRKQKRLYVRRNLNIKYKWMTKTDGRTLWQFYLDRAGSFDSFSFFYPEDDTDVYTKEYVGTGDGSTTIWNLPSKNAASYNLYLDDVLQIPTTDYTFSASGGADGADKVTFVAAPSSGERITWSFTGRLKIRSIFANDYLDFETFFRLLTHYGIDLQGLLNT